MEKLVNFFDRFFYRWAVLAVLLTFVQVFAFAPADIYLKIVSVMVGVVLIVFSGAIFFLFLKAFSPMLLRVSPVKIGNFNVDWEALLNIFAVFLVGALVFSIVYYPWMASAMVSDGLPPVNFSVAVVGFYWGGMRYRKKWLSTAGNDEKTAKG